MCGFVGFFGRTPEQEPKNLLEGMLNKIVHRGPDQRGRYIHGQLYLGTQRLRILDLHTGDQPIVSADENICVALNGEIYNHEELREELKKFGWQFKTRTDTEVVVYLYAQHGISFVGKLNGMFSIALYDKAKGDFYLIRDRLGIKPLFIANENGTLFFSSEINALKLIPGLTSDLDPKALSFFLSQAYIPQPLSAYKKIQRVRAGHYIKISAQNEMTDVEYYDLDFSKKISITREDAQRQFMDIFKRVVHRQLKADVPPSLFLSAGLDSTAILALSQTELERIDNYTLTFPDWPHEEFSMASRWTTHFKQPHHRVVMDPASLLDIWLTHSQHYGEPMGSWITSCQRLLAAKVKQSGYKLAISGAGGDELFCGYPTLTAAILAKNYKYIPKFLRDGVIRSLVNKLPAGSGPLPLSFKMKSFVNAIDSNDIRTFLNFKAILPFERLSRYLTPDASRMLSPHDPLEFYEQYHDKFQDWGMIDALSYLDIKNFLEGSVLAHSDRASMAESVEERVPFLDNELIDFAVQLPINVKFSLTSPKIFLRDTMKQFFKKPEEVAMLKDYAKKGFWMPDSDWIRKDGPLGHYVRERLKISSVEKTGFFLPESVETLYTDHMTGRRNNERSIQIILGMMNFLET